MFGITSLILVNQFSMINSKAFANLSYRKIDYKRIQIDTADIENH